MTALLCKLSCVPFFKENGCSWVWSNIIESISISNIKKKGIGIQPSNTVLLDIYGRISTFSRLLWIFLLLEFLYSCVFVNWPQILLDFLLWKFDLTKWGKVIFAASLTAVFLPLNLLYWLLQYGFSFIWHFHYVPFRLM